MLLTQPKTKTDLHRWKPNWATKFAQNWQTRKILPSSNQQSKELFNWMMLREKLHKVSHVGSLERTRALLQMNGKELRTEDLTHISKFVREVLLRKNIPSGRAAETSTRGSSPQHTRNSLAKHTCPLPNYSHEKGPAKVNYANISRVSSWKKKKTMRRIFWDGLEETKESVSGDDYLVFEWKLRRTSWWCFFSGPRCKLLIFSILGGDGIGTWEEISCEKAWVRRRVQPLVGWE